MYCAAISVRSVGGSIGDDGDDGNENGKIVFVVAFDGCFRLDAFVLSCLKEVVASLSDDVDDDDDDDDRLGVGVREGGTKVEGETAGSIGVSEIRGVMLTPLIHVFSSLLLSSCLFDFRFSVVST